MTKLNKHECLNSGAPLTMEGTATALIASAGPKGQPASSASKPNPLELYAADFLVSEPLQ